MMRWRPRCRCGACASPAGTRTSHARWRRWPRSSRCPTPRSMARRCWCRLPAPGSRRSSSPWSRRGRRCARQPSSAAMQRAIRCLPTGRLGKPSPVYPETTMNRPVPNPGILDIAPYTPGKSPVPEPGRKVFKLSANETPFGPSPKAKEAYRHAVEHLEDYPEGTSRVLREAIGRSFGLDPDRIICGAGSDEILNLLARTYLKHGDEAVSTTHGFLVYPIATMANGAKNVVAAEKDFTADVDAILNAVTPKTKIVWLANPNNPTGTYIPFDEVKRLRAGLPSHIVLVLDAAYADYVSRNDYELGIELVATTDNTVVTHTFSKIHGLAALRVGWMFASAHIV